MKNDYRSPVILGIQRYFLTQSLALPCTFSPGTSMYRSFISLNG
jgi:hypothetical protein